MAWKRVDRERLALLTDALGAEVLARGVLEVLWESTWDTASPVLGAVAEVESRVDWNGKPGDLADMLMRAGFIETAPGGVLLAVEWEDHVPPRVVRRAYRAADAGSSLSEIRSEAGRDGGVRSGRVRNGDTANEVTEPPRRRRLAVGSDPRFRALRAVWEEEFLAATGAVYRWSPADAMGVHRILAVEPEDLRQRARRSLHSAGYLHCGSLAKLTSNEVWNQLVGPPQGANGKARVIAEVGDFSDTAKARAGWDDALGKGGHG